MKPLTEVGDLCNFWGASGTSFLTEKDWCPVASNLAKECLEEGAGVVVYQRT